jgi:hypothetical protein
MEPATYEEALASPQHKLWITAIQAEFDSLPRHQTWQLPLPPNRKSIKWVFKLKDTIPPRPKQALSLVDSLKSLAKIITIPTPLL